MEQNEKAWLENRIATWLSSKQRTSQITGLRYYEGIQDINNKKRTAMDDKGTTKEVYNLPNHKLCNNLYQFCVDQKTSYMLSKEPNIGSPDKSYDKQLKRICDYKFKRTFNAMGLNAMNCGVGYLYPFVDEENKILRFRYIDASEMLVFYKDTECTIIDFAIRLYSFLDKNGIERQKLEKFTVDGVETYDWNENRIISESWRYDSYLKIAYTNENQQKVSIDTSWGRVPLVQFKTNAKMIPLISKIKSLQDALNELMSSHQDNMAEDLRNTILVIRNYEGSNLGEFRQNLATYGAVNVGTVDGVSGDVETLNIKVDSTNYEVVLKELKRAIMLNAKCYDPTDELMNSRPNELNLLALYSTINLDANEMETEWKASFMDLKYFIDKYLELNDKGKFYDSEINIKFNRDVIIDNAAQIDSFVKMWGILSDETALAHNPWVDNVYEELEAIRRDHGDETQYFGTQPNGVNDGTKTDGTEAGAGEKPAKVLL